jgi:hypothetical protein
MPKFGEQFLHQKDSRLHTTDPVEHEQKRKRRKGEKTSQKPAEKISDWLRVIEKTHMGHADDPRVLERIKNYYHKEHVVKPEDIPEAYFENQKRLAREQGHGDIELTPEMRSQLTEVIITDQGSTLDGWVEYLSSSDSKSFPMWAKYWAFNGMLKLSSYDKEKQAFGKRKKGTVAPFPDLNREALAYVVDSIDKKAHKEDIPEETDNPEFQKLLDGANFGKLYSYAIESVTPAEEDELANTKGEWIKYDQNSDHMSLVQSLQGHGTGWCTAGESTAQSQLQGGDFYVYYSYSKDDKKGKPTIPRAAIRMEQGKIAEIRGIAGKDQNLDSYIAPVIQEKLTEFEDGKEYEKKTEDMKKLTEIERKTEKNQKLTKPDLIFLYEIDSSIEGFGYQTDPRIKELRDERNPKEDSPIVFECEPQQIAWNKEEVNEGTLAYIGPLYTNIFKELQHLEHIYTEFPEGRIKRYEIEIGGKTTKELESELEEKGFKIYDYARSMMKNPDFAPSKEPEQADLVRLKVKDMGFAQGATTEQIYEKAEELGLELCPPEVGPHLRLELTDQPQGEWFSVGMKQISDSDGNPDVFGLGRGAGGRWLPGIWACPGRHWRPGRGLVFRSRK